jgi:argininosuccinate lyase
MRDVGRLLDAYPRVDRLPLGSGALAGTPHPIDRAFVAEQLGFSALSENSLDAVSDRDGAVEFMSAAALCMIHLSRMGEELVLWMSQEFQYVDLPDAFCTGSSIMPQKKNPDVAELVRGKAGRVTGDLVTLLMTLKGLPLAYNKDMQEDKEPLFDANDTLADCTQALARILKGAQFNAERMAGGLRAGFVMATDVADALVEAGVPFREAHQRIGALVKQCLDSARRLDDLNAGELKQALPELSAQVVSAALDPVHSLTRRNQPGGPAPEQVKSAHQAHLAKLNALNQRVAALRVRNELLDWMRSGA